MRTADFQLPLFVAGMSALALGTALVAQYVFGLAPCALCVWQRWPYVAVIVLAALAMIFRPPAWQLALLAGAGFLATSGIGLFHVGVEQGWWEGLASCSGAGTPTSVEDLRAQIMGTQPARCDEIPFQFLGLSIAGWNFVFGIAAATMTLRMGFGTRQAST